MLSNLQKFNHLLNDDNLNRSSMNGDYGNAARSNKQRKFIAQANAREVEASKSGIIEAAQNNACAKKDDSKITANSAEILEPQENEQVCQNVTEFEAIKKVEEPLPQNGGGRYDKECNSEYSSQSPIA